MTTSPKTPNAADDVDTTAMRAGLAAIVASSDRGDVTRAASRIEEVLTDIDNKVGNR